MMGHFATMTLLVVDPKRRQLTYANAGHEFPFLQIGRETPVRLNVGDLILGVEEDTQYNEDTIQLGDAARLVIVSDGVTEAFDPSEEQYGTERIEQLMNTVKRCNARELVEAFESSNWDASFEWYFDDVSYFSVAAFYKDFENFLEAQTLPVPGQVQIPVGNPQNPTGPDPILVNVDFQDTRTRNGETGSITGLEIAYQRTFDQLPEPWDGLGAAANYTYVTSNINRDPNSGASDCDYNGLSPNSFNVSGFYEKDGISARLAYNYRDEFLFQCFSNFSEPREREAFGQLDVVANIITSRAAEIDYVDMRYGNGFTIGWNGGSRTPVSDPERADSEMLASRGTD